MARDRQVLSTGATGFVGGRLLRAVVERRNACALLVAVVPLDTTPLLSVTLVRGKSASLAACCTGVEGRAGRIRLASEGFGRASFLDVRGRAGEEGFEPSIT